MSKHTPGPWRVIEDPEESPFVKKRQYLQHRCPEFPEGHGLAWSELLITGRGAEQRTDMERIVACVNACEGIRDTGVVPELVKALREIVADCRERHWVVKNPTYTEWLESLVDRAEGMRKKGSAK